MIEFNSREIANAVWLAVLFAWCLRTRLARTSLRRFLGEIAKWRIWVPLALMALYLSGVVWALHQGGYWRPFLLKATIYWYLFSGIVLLVNTASESRSPAAVMKKELGDGVGIIVAIEYLVWAYTFPLLVELVMAPILALVVAVNSYAEGRPEYASTKKISTPLLVALGAIILGSALWSAIGDASRFASWETARAAALGPVLFFLTLPFVYAFCLLAQYELMFKRLSWGRQMEPGVLRYARWQLVRRHGLRLEKLSQFMNNSSGRLIGLRTRADVDALLRLPRMEASASN